MDYRLNFWIRFLLPLALALFLGVLIFMLAQFREPPGFHWFVFIWFTGSIMIIWEMGWFIGKKLDKSFPWRAGTTRRLVMQLFLTNLIGILFFLSFFVLLNWYENDVLGHKNPLGLLHVLVTIAEAFFIVQMINSIQISYLLLQNWQQLKLEAEALKKDKVISHLGIIRRQLNPHFLSSQFLTLEPLLKEAPDKAIIYLKELSIDYERRQGLLEDNLTDMQEQLELENEKLNDLNWKRNEGKAAYKSRFLVKSGAKFLLIQTTEIVAFYKDEIVLLYTEDGKKYVVDYSLEELSTILDPKCFFRINRQHIIQLKYLGEMRSDSNQFLLTLNISFPNKLIVSQRIVTNFKAWLKEE